MAPRLALQAVLEELLGTGHVYFQPPSNVQMQYPCIVYQRYNAKTSFADNKAYTYVKRYQVTVIDQNPDSLVPDKVGALPSCLHNRFFVADNLNHDVFNLYY